MPAPIPFFQIDAFAAKPFEGNQACVMLLETFYADDVLQAIAAENNVAETAFIIADSPGIWQLRWFTPSVEVPLCGHATLASAHALFHHLGFSGDEIRFRTRQSGDLIVKRGADAHLEMDFPASPVRKIAVNDGLVKALGARPREVWVGAFLAALFDTPDEVLALEPDMRTLQSVGDPAMGWSPGNIGCFAAGGEAQVDVMSRFFAPGSGIDEDPATGSWHCMLAKLMSAKLGKATLTCYQAYPGRGALIKTTLNGDRVKLIGTGVTVIEGVFRI